MCNGLWDSAFMSLHSFFIYIYILFYDIYIFRLFLGGFFCTFLHNTFWLHTREKHCVNLHLFLPLPCH